MTASQTTQYYREEAKKIIKEVDAEVALGNAMQLLSNMNQFNYGNFQPLPRSVRTRLSKKQKIEEMKTETAKKKLKTKEKLKLVKELEKE